MNKGLIHIYSGEGKGKTTATIGLAVRASGANLKVVFVKFLKETYSNEDKSLKLLPNIEIINDFNSTKFTFEMTEEELNTAKDTHTKSLLKAINSSADLIVLDEIISVYNLNLIDKEVLIDFLKNKPPHLEIALTGRNPHKDLLDLADYISEIQAIKHPYDKGINARKGIEF